MTEAAVKSTGIFAAAVLTAVAVGGCAHARPQTLADRFVQRDAKPASGLDESAPWAGAFEALEDDLGLEAPALKEAMAKARRMADEVRPPLTGDATTLESKDRGLITARRELTASSTARNHRRVAEAYARLGVLDAAFDQFTAAITAERRDSLAYDGRARIWRDWGVASPALADAYRAIYYTPKSPIPRNTLGTILLKMGQLAHARAAFELAVMLDPNASYAVNNLCYLSKLEGRTCQAPKP